MSFSLRRLFSISLAFVFAAALAAPALAQDTNQVPAKAKPAKSAPKKEKEARQQTTSGKITAVDKVLKTITLDDKARSVLQISSDTLITKDGQPAIMADGAVGDAVHVTYRKGEDGKLEALLLNYGAKSEPAKPAKAKKTEAKSKKTEAGATNAPAATAPAN
jgi:hypothetical protein